jgi:hypothetical protein
MPVRAPHAIAVGLLAAYAVAPAGAQWVDPPSPNSQASTEPKAEVKPEPAAARQAARPAEPKAAAVEVKPSDAKAPQTRSAETAPPDTRPKVATRTPDVETTGAIKAAPARAERPAAAKPARLVERRSPERRAATLEKPVRAAARPAQRVAAKPVPARRVAAGERVGPRELEMLRIRTIELPDGQQVEIVTRLDGAN